LSDSALLLTVIPSESGLDRVELQEERIRLRQAADALFRHDYVIRNLRARQRIDAANEAGAFLPSASATAELIASVVSFARAAGRAGLPVGDMLDGVSAELRRTALRRAPAPLGGDVRAEAVRRAVRAYYEVLTRARPELTRLPSRKLA
jgi:hypothetical protein